MKKLLFALSFVLFCAMTTFAQTTTADQAAPSVISAPNAKMAKKEMKKGGKAQVANPAAYACMKCNMISKGAGECEHCHVEKVQLGTYYCPKCEKGTGAKAGKCDCGATTVQVTRKSLKGKGGEHMHDMK